MYDSNYSIIINTTFTIVAHPSAGLYNTRLIKALQPKIQQIRSVHRTIQAMSDAEITSYANNIKSTVRSGTKSLNEVLPEAFALVLEASERILGLRPFDVQILGGIFLYQNKIIEMNTGEGKTLVATFAAYLRALAGKGVHIITVNEYLVVRDYEQMKPMFALLGLTTDFIVNSKANEDKKIAYQADIIYGTSSEICFDYLRDNLAIKKEQQVHRGFYTAIVDEADSNMIDEAITPLIISEQDEASVEKFILFNNLVSSLITSEDVIVNLKDRYANLKDSGYEKIENALKKAELVLESNDLYQLNIQYLFYLNAAIQAHFVYQKDKDYLIYEGTIAIISDKTGRIMPGRRWSEGLHQAIEAKENLKIQGDSINLASITLQSFYKLYPNLSGMTGTAITDAYELEEIYKLETVVVPPNKPCIRTIHDDVLYQNEQDKFNAVAEEVKRCLVKQQPVLIGTPTVEASERLSLVMQANNIKHQVLNARYLKAEAKIIAQAGAPGCVTVATNMAGRGTDIILGGNPYGQLQDKNLTPADRARIIKQHETMFNIVKAAGGLYVIGTARNKVRRIDNQLIGRCARQGEPGESRFFMSLDDEVIKIFTDNSLVKIEDMNFAPGERIELPFLKTIITNAQKRIERSNFDSRKRLAYEDEVVNTKRQLFYAFRNQLISEQDSIDDVIKELITAYLSTVSSYKPGEWQDAVERLDVFSEAELQELEALKSNYRQRSCALADLIDQCYHYPKRDNKLERYLVLQIMSEEWKDYINLLNTLKMEVYLKAYAQKDTKVIFEESVNKEFSNLLFNYRYKAVSSLLKLWKALNIRSNSENA